MQLNLRDSGTFLFISDHCHVIENWRDGIPQGWLARDHPAWVGASPVETKHVLTLHSSDPLNVLSSSYERPVDESSLDMTKGRSTRSRMRKRCTLSCTKNNSRAEVTNRH